MVKRKRKPTKKSSNNNLLFALTFAAFAVLGYLGISFITHTPLVAPVTLDIGDGVEVVIDSGQHNIFTDTNSGSSGITLLDNNTGDEVTIQRDQNPPGSAEEAQTIITTNTNTTSTVTCPGGNGTTIPVGMWVPTGGTYNEDSSLRRCVQCGADGQYDNAEGKDKACDDAYTDDPAHTILPTQAGDAYTGGAPTLSNCYRGAKIYPNGALDNNERCYNGGWLELDDPHIKDYNDFMIKLCARQELAFNVDADECQAKSAEAPAEEEPVPPAEAEEPESPGITQDLIQKRRDMCDENEKALNKERVTKWLTCVDSGTGASYTYETCNSGFNSSGQCFDGVYNKEDLVVIREDIVEDPEYQLSGTPFDSSDFTPPGSRVYDYYKCAFGYHVDDHDKITCAERGDENANQTQAQEDRSESRDALADKPNDLINALDPTSEEEGQLSFADTENQSFLESVKQWFQKTFYNETWLKSEDLTDYDSDKPNDLINALDPTIDNDNSELRFADTENQNFFENIRLWFQKTFSGDTQSELEGFDSDKPNPFIYELDKNTNPDPLPTSTFTPPGAKANQLNDCEFAYTTDDFDRIFCAEKGDKDSFQTTAQKERSEYLEEKATGVQ